MAAKRSVWGIDIGQSALKALKCRVSDDGQSVVAESYDYVEYPKLLSSPEANPAELIGDALEQFLSRNETRGDEIAISVPGNTGLARFFKPPPVEAKVLPQLVEFEAKQQIPFPLDEVIWDWQSLGGHEVEGFQLDAEVGIFAMKREHVARALKPFLDKSLEPSTVQLSPLTIFNCVSNEQLKNAGEGSDYDPDNPPPHTLVLSMGTETTDLIFTNGHTLWLRSIPIGGNHFTKILSKELKLTHAKAEQLKRHVMEAEDPKAVFQVMRPVFNDLVNELQRSIRHYQTIDRKAKIEKALLIGNASKLRGLSQYVEQNLGIPVSRLKKFERLEGSEVVNAETFHANAPAFAGAYGLCLQGCGVSKLKTSLLPPEIITDRIVREKKPWAVAAVALVLLGFAANAAFQVWRTWEVNPQAAGADGTTWEVAINAVSPVKSDSGSKVSADSAQLSTLQHVRALGEEVVGNADRKLLWLELLTALEVALPDSTARVPPGTVPDPKTYPFDQRTELYIEAMEAQFFPDLTKWWTEPVQKRYADDERAAQRKRRGGDPAEGAVDPAATDSAATAEIAADAAAPAADPTAEAAAPADPAATATAEAPAAPTDGSTDPAAAGATGPTEQGWVIELRGHHFHNSATDMMDSGENYLRRTLINRLKHGEVMLPVPSDDPSVPPQMVSFTFKELGIEYPIISVTGMVNNAYEVKNPNVDPAQMSPYGAEGAAYGVPGVQPAGQTGGRRQGTTERKKNGTGAAKNGTGAAGEEEEVEEEPEPLSYKAPRYAFAVQFVWKETPLSKRLQARQEAAEKAAAEMATQEGAAPVDPSAVDPSAVPPTDTPLLPTIDPSATNPETPVDPTVVAPGTVPPAGVDPATAVPPVDPAATTPAPVDPSATAPTNPGPPASSAPPATPAETTTPAETPTPPAEGAPATP